MRILLVSAWEPWRQQDGQSLILHHQLQHLGQDHDIRLLVAEGPAPHPAPDGAADARGSYQTPERVRLRGFPLTDGGVAGYLARRWASHRSGEPAHVHWVERPALLQAVRQELAADVPDVLHLQGWGTAQLSRLAGRVPVAHVAGDCWELGLGGRIVPAYRRALDAGQRAKVIDHERRHYPEAGAVVLVAERDADYLRARAASGRYCVIPNGVAAGPGPRPRAWDAEAAPVIAFHGAFDTAPNVAAARLLVTEILPLVRIQHPGARVLLIGRHAGREVRRLAGPHVDVTGAVADVRPWLEQAAVYAAPMMSGTGLKNKVLEAMAAGLPVVASPLALAGIGAGDGVMEASDPARIADALVALLADPDRRRAAGAAGRQRVERDFTWEANAAAVARLWEELLASAPPASRDR